MESYSNIPVVDFSAFSIERHTKDTDNFHKLVKEIHKAFLTIGFVKLENFGIPEHVIQKSFEVSKRFFMLPAAERMKYRSGEWIKDSLHGYVPTDFEILDMKGIKDFKEAFDFRPACKETVSHEFPDISEVPEMKSVLLEMFHYCQLLFKRILEIIAIGLELKDPLTLVKACRNIGGLDNVTTLRTLFYPPLGADDDGKRQIRCGEHTDFGCITILFQDTAGGLEVYNRSGKWIPVTPIPGTVLVNIGDLMQRWTSDVYTATKHRVVFPVCEANRTRQSIAFFGDPDSDVIVKCLDGSAKYPALRAADYIEGKNEASQSN